MKYFQKFFILMVLSCLFNTFVFSISANNGQNIKIYEEDNFKLGFSLEATYLTGETREGAYDVGYAWDYQLSELDWEIDDVFMVGGVLSCQINNKIYVNVGMWNKVSASEGKMEDSDWLAYINWINGNGQVVAVEPLKTDLSKSKTELEKGHQFDFNIFYNIYRDSGDFVTSLFPTVAIDASLSIDAILGYKYDKWKWVAKGGYYAYNMYLEDYTQRDRGASYGAFEYTNVITYEHDLSIPYAGINIGLDNANCGINVYFIFSNWCESDATDDHHLRSLRFQESFERGKYKAYGINIKKDIGSWTIACSYNREKLRKLRGDTVLIDLSDNSSLMLPYHSSISHKTESISFSICKKFG